MSEIGYRIKSCWSENRYGFYEPVLKKSEENYIFWPEIGLGFVRTHQKF